MRPDARLGQVSAATADNPQVEPNRSAGKALHYRADVDGLRAVAILLVIGFHAFPSVIRGGFIGVDIFFVISGFLISSLIAQNLETNSFTVASFYLNRVRRIFPALTVVLTACAVAGWYLLAEGDYAKLGKHIAGGAGFVANLVLWNEAGYFDSSADSKPLLHLWSLGVEEQFYIVWPVVLWLAWRRRWNMLGVTLTCLLLSFAANIAMVATDAVATFYSPATRVWELLIGALLAGRPSTGARWPGLANYPNAMATAGVAAIAIAALALTRGNAFPGWWALLPTAGAALLIAAGPKAWLNRAVLSHPGMVRVGLISYPLYLWHWPLLVFLRLSGALKSDLEVGAVAVGAAFVLSWLTYRVIERPFRSVDRSSQRSSPTIGPATLNFRAAGLLLFMTIAGVSGAAIHQANGEVFRDRFRVAALPPLADKRAFDALKIYEHPEKPNNSCRDHLGMAVLPEEVCVANSAAPKVLFLGDSHAMGLYSAVFANQSAIPSVLIASPGCLIYPNLVYRPNGKEWGQDCTAIARKGLEYARRSTTIDTVVVSLVRKGDNPTALTHFHSDHGRVTELEALSSGLDALIGSLLESGKSVVYVVDIPYFRDTPEVCQSKFVLTKTDQCLVKRSEMNLPFKAYFEVVDRIRAKYPKLGILNAEDVVCTRDSCAQHDGKQYLYIDRDHLSVYGSERVLAKLLERLPRD
jgi:peptidoglycan/LPS O-acetylase OafA/YrhL